MFNINNKNWISKLKKVIYRAGLIFITGYIFRYLIFVFTNTNVMTDTFNWISISYFGIMALFTAAVHIWDVDLITVIKQLIYIIKLLFNQDELKLPMNMPNDNTEIVNTKNKRFKSHISCMDNNSDTSSHTNDTGHTVSDGYVYGDNYKLENYDIKEIIKYPILPYHDLKLFPFGGPSYPPRDSLLQFNEKEFIIAKDYIGPKSERDLHPDILPGIPETYIKDLDGQLDNIYTLVQKHIKLQEYLNEVKGIRFRNSMSGELLPYQEGEILTTFISDDLYKKILDYPYLSRYHFEMIIGYNVDLNYKASIAMKYKGSETGLKLCYKELQKCRDEGMTDMNAILKRIIKRLKKVGDNIKQMFVVEQESVQESKESSTSEIYSTRYSNTHYIPITLNKNKTIDENIMDIGLLLGDYTDKSENSSRDLVVWLTIGQDNFIPIDKNILAHVEEVLHFTDVDYNNTFLTIVKKGEITLDMPKVLKLKEDPYNYNIHRDFFRHGNPYFVGLIRSMNYVDPNGTPRRVSSVYNGLIGRFTRYEDSSDGSSSGSSSSGSSSSGINSGGSNNEEH